MEEQLQLNVINFRKDSYIIIEGDQKADRFYIIRQGKVEITKSMMFEREADSILVPGDFFGVISAMAGRSHIETAQALTDVTLITVHQSQYGAFIQKNPQVAIKIIKEFSKQLRSLGKTLAKYTFKKTCEDDRLQLFAVAEYYYNQKQLNLAFHSYYQYFKLCPDREHADAAKERLDELSSFSKEIIAGINNKELNRTYKSGVMIFAEGEPGDEMFIIQSGSVKITKIVDNNELLLSIQKTEDIFGEMALLENKPRDANVIAHEECQVIAVNKNSFELMIKSQPQFTAKTTSVLAERLWLINKQLDNTCLYNLKARAYNALVIQLEKNRVPLDSVDTSYIFNFGQRELYSMIGLSENEGNLVLKDMLKERKIFTGNDKIWTNSVSELARQAEYYKKTDKLEQYR